MKSMLFLYQILIIACLTSCSIDLPEGTPGCLNEKIKEFKKEKSCDQKNVDQYTFQGMTVFVFGRNCCCDFASDVLDNGCNVLGSLGGIAGKTDINGVNFYQTSSFVRTIWEEK